MTSTTSTDVYETRSTWTGLGGLSEEDRDAAWAWMTDEKDA
jgi:hypothetical protein